MPSARRERARTRLAVSLSIVLSVAADRYGGHEQTNQGSFCVDFLRSGFPRATRFAVRW